MPYTKQVNEFEFKDMPFLYDYESDDLDTDLHIVGLNPQAKQALTNDAFYDEIYKHINQRLFGQ